MRKREVGRLADATQGSSRLGELNPASNSDAAVHEQAAIKGHIPALDAVRGVAISMVTAFRFGYSHEEGPSLGPVIDRLFSLGDRGVDLFFVLSGFLITGILFDAKVNPTHYFRNFYMRRTLRIFPLYYGVLVFSFILLPLFWPGPNRPFEEVSRYQGWLWLYGSNFLMASAADFNILGCFKHFWSLAVEEHFYLFWPLLIYCMSRVAAMRICLVLVVVAAGLRVAILKTSGNFPAATTLTFCRMDSLAIGAFLALAIRNPAGIGAIKSIVKIAFIATLIAVVGATLSKKGFLELIDTVWSILFATVIYFGVTAPRSSMVGRIGRSRILGFFGRYSYGMYVFGNLLFYGLAAWITPVILAESIGSNFLGRLAFLVGMSLATVVVSLVSWNLYEKHFLKLKAYFEAKPAKLASERAIAAKLA